MAHVLNDDAFVKYFVGENPIFLEYCTPISEPVPFFEAAQGIIYASSQRFEKLIHPIATLASSRFRHSQFIPQKPFKLTDPCLNGISNHYLTHCFPAIVLYDSEALP